MSDRRWGHRREDLLFSRKEQTFSSEFDRQRSDASNVSGTHLRGASSHSSSRKGDDETVEVKRSFDETHSGSIISTPNVTTQSATTRF